MMQTDFEEWLTAELKNRGWSQSELARRGGIRPSSINRILNANRKPGIDVVRAIAKAFGMSEAEVMQKAGLLSTQISTEVVRLADEPASIADWLKLGRELTEEERYQALQYARFLREQRATYAAKSHAAKTPSQSKTAKGNAPTT